MANDNENNNPQTDEPMFSVQKIYTRDISFENPNSPQVFMEMEDTPKIDLNLGVENRRLGDEHWEVSLKVSVLARNSKSGDVVFEVEVEQAGLFMIRNIPEEHMAGVLAVECPAILFPYTRQVVSQLTVDGGFVPLLLDPVNFAGAFQNQLAQQAAGAEAGEETATKH